MTKGGRLAAGPPGDNATEAGASSPAALVSAGRAHRQAGRLIEAQICAQKAITAEPECAEAKYLLGLLAHQANHHDHAVEWLTAAIRRDPKPEYLAALGATLQRQGRHGEAFDVLDKAVQLSPEDSELWRQLGDILLQLERLDEALLTFEHVLRLNPRHHDALYRSGALLGRLGRHEEALARLDRSDDVSPNHVPTLQARAEALYRLKRFEDALSEGRRADRLDPGNADICNHVGLALRRLGRHEEALGWFDKAFRLRPGFVAALDNKIVSLLQLHRFAEIFALYERMRTLGLNGAQTEWNLSLVYLLTGDFEAGWPRHQARLKLPSATYPQIPRPMWLGGETIEGRTILVAADEGLGDTIQFVRYVPLLASRGARVLLVVQDPLHGLLSGMAGISHCAAMSAVATLPAFDLHCPLSSLPLAFATRLDTIPSATSYLPTPDASRVQAWEGRLGAHARPRVGLVWSGNPNHTNDDNRSIPLRSFSRILDVDAMLVSLQKDPRPSDAVVLRERTDIIDLTADLTDFSETAALVACLDLIITVDTSVAHLAAAMGRPTWILLPYTPDYRWLLDRDDSPWYPSVRLFRQTGFGNWDDVLERVRSELRNHISAGAVAGATEAG
jgi:tetratricopeptide (TPR) repeat protein